LVEGFVGPSIYKMLDEYMNADEFYTNDTWNVYFVDAPTPLFVEYTREHPKRFHEIENFYRPLETGDLPVFSWIDP
jgi:hypothetical protein